MKLFQLFFFFKLFLMNILLVAIIHGFGHTVHISNTYTRPSASAAVIQHVESISTQHRTNYYDIGCISGTTRRRSDDFCRRKASVATVGAGGTPGGARTATAIRMYKSELTIHQHHHNHNHQKEETTSNVRLYESNNDFFDLTSSPPSLSTIRDITTKTLSPSTSSLTTATKETEPFYFWGGPCRTKEEIRRHCAQTIFPNEQYIHTRKRINILSTELPLITIDNFISKEQCQQIIHAAKDDPNHYNININRMTQSTMGVSQQISESRTSSTLWLHEHECEKPLRNIAGKVSRLVGLDASHMENLQVVKYEEGQKFDVHTDHLDCFNDLEVKGRLATCLIYLNSSSSGDSGGRSGDSSDGGDFRGGCTHFPEFETYVFPKQGRAVFWFNTIEKPGSDGYHDDMFLNVDLRSRHSGEPVYGGEKWVCNRWIHPVPLKHGVRGDD